MWILLVMAVWGEHAFQWPVDPGHGVTAAYGEYRGLRLHMGLDFSTGGVEGMRVLPAAAGRVYRVRAQDNGYGRAIYMEHADGWVTVYAHLAAFGPKLSEAIRAAGYAPETNFGTLNLKTPLERDDLLAYSGESGAGLPHFHFEVRKGENTPHDPLTLDFPPLEGDGGKPVVSGIYLEPLDATSRINGGSVPFTAQPGGPAVQARGRIGLRIPAYVAGARGSRLGCRGLTVTLDGQAVDSWMPRDIPYDVYRRGGLVHDQAFSGFSPTTFVYCFDDRADLLPPLPGYRRERVLEVSKASRLEISVMNMAGTWTRVALTLDPDAPLQPATAPAAPPVQATTLHMHAQGDRVLFRGDTEGALQLPSELVGLAPDTWHAFQPNRGDAPVSVLWRTGGGSLTRTVGVLPDAADYTYRVGPWQLTATQLGTLPPVAVFLEPVDPKIMSDTLHYHTPVLHFGRPGMPTTGLRVAYVPEAGEAPDHLGIYAWSFAKNKWRHWGVLGDGLSVDLDYLTPMVVAEDLSPPVIRAPFVHRFFAGARTVIPVSDKGSGIDGDGIVVSAGDQRMAATYDGDRSWIILPEGSGKGPWSVTVSDRSGLTTRVNRLTRR